MADPISGLNLRVSHMASNRSATTIPEGRFGLFTLAALGPMQSWPLAWRLVAAAVIVFLALAIRVLFLGALGQRLIFMTFYPAVALSALVGGLAGGALSLILSVTIAHLVATPHAEAGWEGAFAFVVGGSVLIGLGALLRFAIEEMGRAQRESERQAQFRQFIEQAPTAMAMLDGKMRYLAASARWREGCRLQDDIIGKSHCELIPEIAERSKDILRRALAGEVLEADEEPFVRPDGSTRWLRWEARPWRDHRNVICGLILFFEDISERIEARNALRDLADNLPDSLVFSYASEPGGKSRFLYISAGVEKLHGVTAEQVLADATLLRRQVLPEFLPKLAEASKVSKSKTISFAMDLPIRRADGEVRWLRSWVRPVQKADGQIVWQGVENDITEQKKAEQSLRESEQRFRATIDAALEGIITIDERGRIRSVNPAALETFGYESDELLGHSVAMLFPESRRAALADYIAAHLRAGEAKTIGERRRVEGVRRNGEVFPNELTITEAHVGDQRLFIAFMRDLSAIEAEKRRVDEVRDELARVGRLNDMGEVVAGMAHELGQPIAAMRNFMAAGRRMLPPESPAAEALGKAQDQGRRASDILSRLRGFIEKRHAERTLQDLGRLIEDAITLSLPGREGRAAQIVRRLADGDIFVTVDGVQIEQVLINLLRNAQDATADSQEPEIVISTAIEAPDLVRVSVADNGLGVDPKVAKDLFEAFVTTKISGMGVGLSICKSIIESHGGMIGFTANEPRGAVFFFTLPFSAHLGRDALAPK